MSACRRIAAEAETALDEAVLVLRGGGIVAFPTETFYGLAVDPFNAPAVLRLLELKGRDPSRPLPLIAGNLECVIRFFRPLPEGALELARAFWPGPLTLVLPAPEGIDPAIVSSSGGMGVAGAGVRVPGLPWPRELAVAFGGLLTATSANKSAAPPARLAQQVETGLGEGVSLVVDGGETPGGRPSTIVDLLLDPPRLVREGAVGAKAIETALGRPLSPPF